MPSEDAGKQPNLFSADAAAEEALAEAIEETAEEARVSRDELILARFPISTLIFQSQKDVVIRQTRQSKHPVTRKAITQEWIVEGSPTIGLPSAGDEPVLLVAIELTREAGWPQTVYFSRRDFLERLRWEDSKASYGRLQLALQRLASVKIHSQNVLWDKASKRFFNHTVNVMQEVAWIAGHRGRHRSLPSGAAPAPELPLSYFVWSDAFHRSMQQGNLKPIDLNIYFSLRLPVARRLFRLLDAVRYDGKPKWEIGLSLLCQEYLSMAPAKYPSLYKRTLEPAHAELTQVGFLDRAEIGAARTKEGFKVSYWFTPRYTKRQNAPNLDLHEITLREMIEEGRLSLDNLDSIREQMFFLDDFAWNELKFRLQGK